MALAGEVPLTCGHMCTLWPGSGDLPIPAGSLLSCPGASLFLPPPRVAMCSRLPSWHCPPCPAAHPCQSHQSQTSCEYKHRSEPPDRPRWASQLPSPLGGGLYEGAGTMWARSPARTSPCHRRRESGSGACLDLQVIDTVRSRRDKEDAAMHHVLRGSLYKPRRRVSPRGAGMDRALWGQLLTLCLFASPSASTRPATAVTSSLQINKSAKIKKSSGRT